MASGLISRLAGCCLRFNSRSPEVSVGALWPSDSGRMATPGLSAEAKVAAVSGVKFVEAIATERPPITGSKSKDVGEGSYERKVLNVLTTHTHTKEMVIM